MTDQDLHGTVALVTGASQGIGEAVARHLAGRGAQVVCGDVSDEAGAEVAAAIGGTYTHLDVRSPEANQAAVDLAVETYGGLDLAFLNAGVTSGCGIAENFDLAAYRRAMDINLDGVVFGVNAAVPALRTRGGGRIVLTASMAGITAVPLDPFYAANKHAVVGLARSLGPALAPEGIVVNALCPSFARTAIIDGIEEMIEQAGLPILEVADVVGTFADIVERGEPGQCWYVIPGRTSEPFGFRGVPGPR